MKRNIVEEIIYNSADVSPDFSRIEKRLSLPEEPKKTRHAPVLKRVLALFLGVLVISGAVLGAVRLLNDGEDTGGGIGDGGGQGEDLAQNDEVLLPIMMCEFIISDTEFSEYEYGEEINIALQLYPNPKEKGWILDGPLTITLLENEDFEIVGAREFCVDDYKPGEHHKDNPTTFEFTVKPLMGDSYFGALEFEVNYTLPECEPNDYLYYDLVKHLCNDIDNGVCARYSVWYANYQNGVRLEPQRLLVKSDIEKDSLIRRQMFFSKLDSAYITGEITKSQYLDKVYSYNFNGRPSAPMVSQIGSCEYVYASQDFVAKMVLPQNLYNEIYDRNTPYEERLQKEFIYSLLEVLRSAEALDEVGYNAQKQLIDKYGATLYEDLIVKELKESIPKAVFDTILDHRFDITVGETEDGELGLIEDPGTFEVYAKGDIVFDPDEIYWKNDTVSVKYNFSYGPSWYTEIAEYYFIGNGFTLASDIVYEDGKISLSVVRDKAADEPSFSLEVILDTGDSETLEFYARRIGGALIVRTGSHDRFEHDCEDFAELRRNIIIAVIAVSVLLTVICIIVIKVCKGRRKK